LECCAPLGLTFEFDKMNESDTRAHYIDPALQAKGWRVVPSVEIIIAYRDTR